MSSCGERRALIGTLGPNISRIQKIAASEHVSIGSVNPMYILYVFD
jgi:hypothetical protein